MAELSLTQEPTRAELRAHMRSLSGSEQKALNAVFVLEEAGEPTTAEAIAIEANLSRATVFRALARLTAAAYIEYHTTPTGKRIAAYSLSILGQAISNTMIGLHNKQSPTIPENSTHKDGPKDATRVADFPGLTRNFETPVSNRDTSERGNPSNVNKDNNESNVKPQRLGKYLTKLALDRAKQSAHELDDNNSIGMHMRVWQAAYYWDTINGNEQCVTGLSSLFYILRGQKREQQEPQGRAWNSRSRALFKSWGLPDPCNRSASTAPAGSQRRSEE